MLETGSGSVNAFVTRGMEVPRSQDIMEECTATQSGIEFV